jgi:O-antigen biosynthesis protein
MLLPIKPVDFELTTDRVDELEVPQGYPAARVLVRWHGIPVGSLEVPVRLGRVCPEKLAAGLTRELVRGMGQEYAARALARGNPAPPGELAALPPPPAGPTERTTLSVIICTRDRPHDLAVCLRGIERLDPPPYEVLIVDNAPATEATAELLRRQYSNFRYVREDTPGLDHARNRGLREAQGELVAFTDDDVVVDPRWVGALSDAFAADPSLGLVTGLIEPYELETEAQVLFERYGGFGRGYRRTYVQAWPGAALSWTQIGAGQLGAGANMAMRRRIFDEIGFFDPALDVGTPTLGGGDHEIFHRLIKSGWLCLYEPAALVRHRHRRSLEQLQRLLYDYGHATRCYLERVELNFPEDRPGVRQLSRWWWRHWGLKRWRQSLARPGWFPREFVTAEIRGYRAGRGGYLRARRSIVAAEAQRPDAFRVPSHDHSLLQGGKGYVTLDLNQPLRDLPEGRRHTHLEVVVQRDGQSLGSVTLTTHGQPVSARRLADELAQALWLEILRPYGGDPSSAAVALSVQLARLCAPRRPTAHPTLPVASASIIVATCDRPDDLRRCLQSLQKLVTTRPLQRIVVDNRPASGLTPPVVKEFPGIELITESRPGSSYARNAGIAAARGDFIVMTDDDMVVLPEWLDKLLAPFARADVFAVTGATLPGRVETEAEKHFETYGGFSRGFGPREYNHAWFLQHRRRAVPTWRIGGSGNSAYRAEIFRRADIGVFDERLGSGVPTGVGEDTKLFYDILHAGYTIMYEPAAVAWHYHRVSIPALRRQIYGYSKGHVAYHLITWLQHDDKRALARIVAELPLSFAQRALARLRGRYRYPWRLLLTEIAGTLAGPWSLWAAHRNVRRLGLGARPGAAPVLRPNVPAMNPPAPVWEAAP